MPNLTYQQVWTQFYEDIKKMVNNIWDCLKQAFEGALEFAITFVDTFITIRILQANQESNITPQINYSIGAMQYG